MNQEMTISADKFSLPQTEGSKWDFHVAILPMLQQASYYSSRLAASCHLTTGGSGDESPFVQMFPISVSGAVNGEKTFIYDTGMPAFLGVQNGIAGYFSNPSSTIQIPRVIRVASIAFEVIDETPKYYQQGSVTCYIQPGVQQRTQLGYTATPIGAVSNAQRTYTSAVGVAPVNSLAQATIIPGTKSWKASEGAYVVGRRFNEDNPFTRPGVSDVCLYSPNDPDNPLLKNSYFSREAFNAVFSSSTLSNYDSFNCAIPYHTSGAYFTGVSGQYGTFKLKTRIVYEVLPDPLDTTLTPLGIPPLKRDFKYEMKLALLLSNLDPYCPQTMNPKGEWWRSAVSTYNKISKVVDRGLNSPVVDNLVPEKLQSALQGARAISKVNAIVAKEVNKMAKEHKKKNKSKKDKTGNKNQ
jgi:hypothetical protein